MGMDRKKLASANKRATLDQLRKKQAATRTVYLTITDDAGEDQKVELLFRGVSYQTYDRLVDEHTPTEAERAKGLSFHVDTFAPALIAATCVDPAMSVEDAQELWTSDNWNRGELMALFNAAVEVCMQGADIPFISTA